MKAIKGKKSVPVQRKSKPDKALSVSPEKDRILSLFADVSWDPGERAKQLLDLLPNSGDILLTSHDNPDPDSLASCLALQTLIRAKKRTIPRIAIGGILGRAENRAMSLKLDLDLHPIEMLMDKTWDAVILVDAQPGSGNANLPPTLPTTAVIDHHPLRKPLNLPFVDVRPEYGAVSTILVEYLRGQKVAWNKKLATALFYAIKSETADLGRGICDADQRAYFALFDSVDWELLHAILKAKIPGDYFSLFLKGIERAKLYGDALVTDLGHIPVPDAVAELADFLLRHEKVRRSLVIGQYEDQIVYSIRFSKGDLDAGAVASTIVNGFGAGGGHDQMAGGRIILTRANRRKRGRIRDAILHRFLDAVGMEQFKPGTPLLITSFKKGRKQS